MKIIFYGFILALTVSACNNNSSNTSSGKNSIQDAAKIQNRKSKTGYKYVKDAEQVIVYYKKNRYAAWPANNGAFSFEGDEMLVGFTEASYELKKNDHNIGLPYSSWLAHSKDGGETWSAYDPENFVGDYGAEPELKKVEEPIDFEAPRFIMRVVGTAYHGSDDHRGHFFYSYDAGQTWKGPFSYGDLLNYSELKKYGLEEITSRTDYVVTGKNECIVMMSAREKGEFGTDRLFSIKTEDDEEVPLNPAQLVGDTSIRTSAFDTLDLITTLEEQILTIDYQATYPKIIITEDFDPETVNLYYPSFIEEALTNYIASLLVKGRVTKASEGEGYATNTFTYKYDNAIQKLIDLGLAEEAVASNSRFENRGWV